ncbi:MAG: hypothetical protein RLY21_2281 [Planctomycetota bacterium]|jgi:hypothetical protein
MSLESTQTPLVAAQQAKQPCVRSVSARAVLAVALIAAVAGCAAQQEQAAAPSVAAAFPLGNTPPSGRDPATIPPPVKLSADAGFVVGSAKPTVFDSRTVAKQIDRRAFPGPQKRPGELLPEHKRPPIAIGAPNGLTYAMQGTAPRNDVDAAFPAIGATAWSPPDPCLAVGPAHILATVNMKVAWYGKDGAVQFENFLDSTGNPGFFEEVGGGAFTFDPKCFYDERAGRFVVLALEYYSATVESWITFAVSDDSDPNGVWFKYRTPALFELTPGCRYFVDYPGFGYDGDAWYVTCNLFRLASPTSCASFGGTLVRVFEKPGALSGATAVWRDVLDTSASWQVGSSRSGTDAARLVSVNNSTSLAIARVDNPLTAPTLVKANCTVPSMQSVSSAPTPAGTLSIVDRRIFNAAVRDGRVFAANHPALVAGGPAGAVWYEVDVSGATPTLVQSGRITAATGEHTIFPAVAVNDGGSVALVYGRTSATLNPTLEVAGRLPCDPPGVLGASTVIGASTTSPSGSNRRWGDYFATAIDPTDGRTFWVIGELQNASGWTTEIASLRIGRAGDLSGDGKVDGEDLSQLLSRWGLPGAGDIDGSGVVDGGDLSQVLSDWGPCGP